MSIKKVQRHLTIADRQSFIDINVYKESPKAQKIIKKPLSSFYYENYIFIRISKFQDFSIGS
jgi:hypothetical protein